jgi:putative nucleotidyltransferase with HDIG domain
LISAAGSEFESDRTVDGVLEKGLWWAERIFGLTSCAILLLDEDAGVLRMFKSRGYRPSDAVRLCLRPGEGIEGRALSERATLQCAVLEGVRVGVPLVTDDGAVGVLAADLARTDALTAEELDLLGLFAVNVSASLHNARLVERASADAARLQTRARDLAALNEIGMRIATFTDLDSLIDGAMGLARQTLFFRSCALLLWEGEELIVRGHYGFGEGVDTGLRIPRGKGVAWRCVERGEAILVPDVSADPDHVAGLSDARCEMAAPIHGPKGVVGVLMAESPKSHAFNETSLELFATFAHQVASAIENARLHETNRKTFYQTIRALAQALEMRDSYTHGHSERVRTYATEIARLMELSPRDIEILEQAALLHDIGKIGVRDSVLLKTASLNAEERAIIERHPVIGDSILHPVGFLREALESVLHHHEHWDGNGYPSGQKGEEIPLVARIIAVADAYDAMTSDRPYRQAMDSSAAVSEIRNGSGHHFDPVVVRAFLATIGVRMEMDSLAHGMVLPALG